MRGLEGLEGLEGHGILGRLEGLGKPGGQGEKE